MRISARLENWEGHNQVTLRTGDDEHDLQIPPQAGGFGSSASGGELLFLALASCYCNDIYREAAKDGISIEHVRVEVEGEFGAEGDPAKNVVYRSKVTAVASEAEIRELMRRTDQVAEIQNSLRVETPVVPGSVEAKSR